MKPKSRINRFEVLAYIVLVLFGVTTAITASIFLDQSSPLLQVAVNIGSDLIIIGGLFFYYRALFLDPASQLSEIIEKTPVLLKSGITAGVEEVYLRRDEVPKSEWMTLVYGAKKELRILAVAMQRYVAAAQFPSLIADLHGRGVSCRIILMHPESSDVEQRAKMDRPISYAPPAEVIKNSIYRLKLELSGLGIVRLHQLAHTCDIAWADDTMYVSLYLAGGPGDTSPCMKVIRKQEGIFDRYRDHFDALWDHEETVKLEDFELKATSFEKG